MSITTTTRVAGPFDGNGISTSFPFAFKAFQPGDLYVELTNTSGITAALTLNVDYSVTLNADQDETPGGAVVLVSALSTGAKLSVTTDIPDLQPVVLTNMGAFFPAVVNKALDRLTILIQQIRTRIGRTLTAPVSDPVGVSLVLPSATARAGTLLAFDASGAPYAYPTSSPVPPPYGAYTSPQTQVATDGQTVFTLGTAYTQANGSLAVYRNGQRMEISTDYVETDTTHVTFTSGMNAGDRIQFVIGIEVSSGTIGPTGLQGPIGPPGPQGATGPAGANGTGTGDVTTNTAQTITAPKRGTITSDSDLSFDLNVTNNFTCTTAGSGTLTFTNIAAGQGGFIVLTNASNHTISAAATSKISATDLARISVTGTYLVSYFSNGTNVYCVASGAL